MARYSQFDYYQQSPSTLDVPPSEEDEMSVLDDKILDSTSPELSDPRRSSYDAAEAYSHRNSVWSTYSHASSSDQSRPTSHLGHSVLDSTGASFMPVDGPQPYSQASWSLSRTASGSCTPTAYEQFPSEAESNSNAAFSGGAVGPVGAIPMGPVSYRNGMGFAPSGGVAMSPQSSQGWMPAPMDLADAAAQSKSASYRNGSPLTVRRDGIRKKNARFEIPAERTLSNIDHLISQSTNEEETKELKQQKRLLRNRQAALDSRQRKKLHTEKLEEEKKQYTHAITHLEDMVASLRKREADLLREKGEWISQQQQITQYLEGVHMEKDEMIRVHTLETAELRKKNNILMETVEKFERGIKPSGPENHPGDFSGFENMSMEGHPWEEFTMANGLSMPDSMPAPATAVAHSHSMVQMNERPAEKPAAPTSDYPFSWNAFYMCLLFGAFIASNNTLLPGRSLPQMSEEYRAESANVLKAVLASSPSEVAHPASHGAVSASVAAGPEPTAITGMDMGQMGPAPVGSSALDELHDTLVMPTADQERAQVFAINADQYNSLTTFEDDGSGFKPQQPSDLQQALAAMRNNAAQHRMHDASASNVYTRSLMWEQVPQKVIRDFQRMVQEFGAAPVKQEMVGFQSV
ncbi:uncharacterized protein N7459_002261 [Penicillium hispanicum]|uniref:uncharacterized protein n=1 Tax=Penicillium hispanicum TaxID=1080232 RepID=UPI002540760E|nr:uncharacterized protein N7459_002261 [Penicillium hispanicum]KAJ5591892.1 hypothetical protein N7459_002261 [Penicillium hispanicum]